VLDRVVPMLAGVTVVAFAAGSSSVGEVKEIGLAGRWIVLAVLAVAAAMWARGRPFRAVAALAAGGFAGLALVSSLWSVAPRLSAERGASLTLLLATTLLIAAGARGSAARVEHVLLGLLGGAAGVALLGVLVLAVSYGTAVVHASLETPPRYRGFGENANTVALLLALAVPLALHWVLRARTSGARVLAGGTLALFAATIVGAGSRGALLSGAIGAGVTIALAVRGSRRLAIALGAVLVAAVVGAALQSLPQESSSAAPPPAAASPAAPRYVDVERVYPLGDDVGRPLPGGGEPEVERSLFGASGRTEAWRGAIALAAERPLLGFGFGTEARVFVDRYYAFVGARPENSYIGASLQLGFIGLAALLALLAVLVAGSRGAPRGWAAACAGVVAAGLAVAVVQSYLYSAGNIASATFWIAAFLLPALAAPREAG
jgi:hypothetical protein